MDPTGGTFAGFIVEPIDVVTMAVMGADITDLIIAPTITGLIVGMCVECTVVHIDGVITDASMERPLGRAPIGEPRALAYSQPGAPMASRPCSLQILRIQLLGIIYQA